MGEVWAAEDTRLHRNIALKTLPVDFAADPERIRRFEREAHSVASLNHPNIVTIYSIEWEDGIRFITMELVEGRQLASVIPRKGLPLEEFFPLSIQLADALSTAHQKGIVHRDLKPGNIMVTRERRVKILDFGLAKLLASPSDADPNAPTATMTKAGQVVGTMPYMSPEQIKGHEVDERTDLFSLGCVLHEMACGQRAFQSPTAAEISSSILRDQPPSISRLRPELPHHLGRIVSLCLAKDADRRYQSALNLRNELEVLQREVDQGVIRPSTLSTTDPPPRRTWPRRLGWAAAGVAALALLAILGRLSLSDGRGGDLEVASLAVLPLENLTGDSNLDYVAEGVSAGLITQLGELSNLRVASRSETRALRGQSLPPREIARRLGVEAVLDGYLQRDETGLQVGVDLKDYSLTGEVVWSRTTLGQREHLFELQSEIAQALIRDLAVDVPSEQRDRLLRKPTTSDRAYALYLQGQQFLEAVDSPRNAQLAGQVFEQATRLDSDFALARVGLSEAKWRTYEFSKDPAVLREAEQVAERALEIDPLLPAALVAMARVHRSAGRYAASIAELRPILERHPRPDEAYRELAAGYSRVGDLDAAERSLEAAVALRSDYWAHWNELGSFLQEQGRYAEAREAYERASELAPEGLTWPLENLGSLRIWESDFEGAIEIYETFALDTSDPQTASNLATAYFFTGRLADAERYYRRAVRLAPDDAGQRGNLGDVLARLGRDDEALAEYRLAHRMQQEVIRALPDNPELRMFGALYAAKARECPEAVGLARGLATELPRIAENVHFLAWVYALCGERDEAIASIREAIELGIPAEFIGQEDEFEELRDDPEFRRLVEVASAAGG